MPDVPWREYVRSHLPPLEISPERELEIVDELALQLEAAYEAALAGGASPDQARQRAANEVPDWAALARTVTRIEQSHQDARAGRLARLSPERGALMTGFIQDFRHAWRGLRHAPGYSAVAVVTLALGLALGAAAFSLVDAVLLRPLPYGDAERLVLLKATVPPEGRDTVEITYPDAQDLAQQSTVFEELAVLMPYAGTTTMTEPPSRIEGFEVSPSLLSTFGIDPAVGRDFTRDDGDPAGAPVAMIGYGFWQRLGSPPDIVGRTIVLNEVPRTIVGVAPRGFRIELIASLAADVFVPLTSKHPFAANRGIRAFRAVARLRDGVTLDGASAAAATIGSRLAQAYPDTNRGRSFSAHPLQEEIVGNVRSQLWLVAGLVALVLLVAAVNLAGLLLTRAMGRVREMAVRIALGAGRWRLVRESIAEGLLLSLGGAVAGALVARAVLDALRVTPGVNLPRLGEIGLDWRALGALAGAAAAIACTAGAVPLAIMRRMQGTAALRTGHETAGRPALRLRGALVIGQTAFAFLLLAAAALLATSLRAILTQPPGFETSQVVTMRIAVPDTRYVYRDDTVRFYTELLDTLRAQPSVGAAGVVSTLPLAGNTGSTLTVQGREDVPLATRPTIGWQWASPGYFAAIGIPLVTGRDFTAADVTRTPHVTVVNETLVRLHFPGEDPIGKRVYFGGYSGSAPPEWHEVIGVVGDVRHRTLEGPPDARAYDLFGQHWGRTVSLAVRTADSSLVVAGLVRQLLAQRDPRLAVFSIRTTEDLLADAVRTRRLLLWLVSGFALIGLTVSLVGLYGTLSYIVAQRRREMGVRLALGATGAQVRQLIVMRGLQLVAAGLVIGLGAAVALREAIEGQLFGIGATNVPALAGAAFALVATALVACLVPAVRAMKVNPVEALRIE